MVYICAVLLAFYNVQVVGVDYCGRFVDTAMQIQNNAVVKFGTRKEAKLPDGVNANNVNFVQVSCHNNTIYAL